MIEIVQITLIIEADSKNDSCSNFDFMSSPGPTKKFSLSQRLNASTGTLPALIIEGLHRETDSVDILADCTRRILCLYHKRGCPQPPLSSFKSSLRSQKQSASFTKNDPKKVKLNWSPSYTSRDLAQEKMVVGRKTAQTGKVNGQFRMNQNCFQASQIPLPWLKICNPCCNFY